MNQGSKVKKNIDIETFKTLVALGLNVTQIRIAMGFGGHNFGYKVKQILGMYPSVFIYKYKKGNIKL